jgi:DNA-binding Lrp family transcriptional regulator
MAVQAYVLVDCVPGTAHQVVDALTRLPGVETAHAVTGVYNVIAFLRAESMAEMGDLLTRHIQRLKGILKTNTNVVVEPTAAHRSMESDRGRRA